MIYNYEKKIDPDSDRTTRDNTTYYGTALSLQEFLKDNLLSLLEGESQGVHFRSIEIQQVEGIFLNGDEH